MLCHAVDGGLDGADGAEQQDRTQAQALEGQEAAGLVLDVAEGDAVEDDSAPGAVVPAAADNLSDLDDDELDQYLCTEEEVKMKKQIWMISNKYVYLPCRCVLFSLSSVVLLH